MNSKTLSKIVETHEKLIQQKEEYLESLTQTENPSLSTLNDIAILADERLVLLNTVSKYKIELQTAIAIERYNGGVN